MGKWSLSSRGWLKVLKLEFVFAIAAEISQYPGYVVPLAMLLFGTCVGNAQ